MLKTTFSNSHREPRVIHYPTEVVPRQIFGGSICFSIKTAPTQNNSQFIKPPPSPRSNKNLSKVPAWIIHPRREYFNAEFEITSKVYTKNSRFIFTYVNYCDGLTVLRRSRYFSGITVSTVKAQVPIPSSSWPILFGSWAVLLPVPQDPRILQVSRRFSEYFPAQKYSMRNQLPT